MVQNKLHYAVHRHTAAELIVERADAYKEHMGLTTWETAPHGKTGKADVSIAKNYLKEYADRHNMTIVGDYIDRARNLLYSRTPDIWGYTVGVGVDIIRIIV